MVKSWINLLYGVGSKKFFVAMQIPLRIPTRFSLRFLQHLKHFLSLFIFKNKNRIPKAISSRGCHLPWRGTPFGIQILTYFEWHTYTHFHTQSTPTTTTTTTAENNEQQQRNNAHTWQPQRQTQQGGRHPCKEPVLARSLYTKHNSCHVYLITAKYG